MTQCYLNGHTSPETKVQCQNCDWTGTIEDTEIISDIEERIAPGEIVPAGECPECGCLTELSEWPDWSYVAQVKRLKAINANLVEAARDAQRLLLRLRDRGAVADAPEIRALIQAANDAEGIPYHKTGPK